MLAVKREQKESAALSLLGPERGAGDKYKKKKHEFPRKVARCWSKQIALKRRSPTRALVYSTLNRLVINILAARCIFARAHGGCCQRSLFFSSETPIYIGGPQTMQRFMDTRRVTRAHHPPPPALILIKFFPGL